MNLLNLATDSFSKYRRSNNQLGDGHRPYNFKAKISLPLSLKLSLENLIASKDLLMKTFEIPNLSMQTTKMSIFGKEVALPVGINTNNEITMEFYVDDDFITRDAFDFWIKSIDKSISSKIEAGTILKGSVESVPKDKYELISGGALLEAGKNLLGNVLGVNNRTANDFLGSISVKPTTIVGMRIVEYILWNVYPVKIDAVKLDQSDINNISSVRVTFAYTHYTRKNISLLDSVAEMGKDAIGL